MIIDMLFFYLSISTLFISRFCGIADEDDGSYIITGGVDTRKTVTKYDKNGFMEDLPSLNTGRWDHGCGTYLDSNSQNVS